MVLIYQISMKRNINETNMTRNVPLPGAAGRKIHPYMILLEEMLKDVWISVGQTMIRTEDQREIMEKKETHSVFTFFFKCWLKIFRIMWAIAG